MVGTSMVFPLGIREHHSAVTPRFSVPLNANPTASPNMIACESHDERNMRLKRPMSPHLQIYQIQLTWVLSITHRSTGMMLSSYAIFLGLGTLFIPGGIPCFIETVQNLCLPTSILFAGKTLLALPATFHTFNGLRHLMWDLGQLLTIKEVYSTGYLVTGLSVISALALAMM
ncbi:Succinate dehydrogenase cytochrome b560 subunit, mitochondrial [Ooceraea biroi]|uniref:Succinate dehydrogenase cytochrome b560 subunit, mitochondrial n=1 Tax=Ooceraea biroi TaxID=2015173 RepID=A0A026WGK9_OOCBI|nr:Succinate dehydrogenase cytochrome b560 subunit, mitochondrial [Ooceraea biroi]